MKIIYEITRTKSGKLEKKSSGNRLIVRGTRAQIDEFRAEQIAAAEKKA